MKLKLSIILLLLIIACKSIKKEVEIKDDFSAEVEYRLEKSNSTWRKRGVIKFEQKNNKNNKSNLDVINETLTNEQIEEIKSECKNGNSLYFVRIKLNNSLFFSSVKTCEIMKNKFNDRFIVNYFGQITSDGIISINYDIDNKYILNKSDKDTKNFTSSVEYVDNIQSIGPIFPEEKEVTKAQQQQTEQQSFFSKYWWIIMIVVVMMMIRGPAAEEGASQ